MHALHLVVCLLVSFELPATQKKTKTTYYISLTQRRTQSDMILHRMSKGTLKPGGFPFGLLCSMFFCWVAVGKGNVPETDWRAGVERDTKPPTKPDHQLEVRVGPVADPRKVRGGLELDVHKSLELAAGPVLCWELV